MTGPGAAALGAGHEQVEGRPLHRPCPAGSLSRNKARPGRLWTKVESSFKKRPHLVSATFLISRRNLSSPHRLNVFQTPGGRSGSLAAPSKRPGLAIHVSGKPQLRARIGVVRARARDHGHCPISRPIVEPRPAWCTGGAFEVGRVAYEHSGTPTALPIVPVRLYGVSSGEKNLRSTDAIRWC